MVVGQVGDRLAVVGAGGAGGVAEGGDEVEVGQRVTAGGREVELELLDRLLLRERFRVELAGQLVGGGEVRGALGVRGEVDRARTGVEREHVDLVHQALFRVADGLLALDHGVAGAGDADLGAEHVEVRHHPGGAAGLILVEEPLVALERELGDAERLSGSDEVVVGVLGVGHRVEHRTAVAGAGNAEREPGVLQRREGRLPAEVAQQGLVQGSADPVVVGRVEQRVNRVGGAARNVRREAQRAIRGGEAGEADAGAHHRIIIPGALGGGAIEPVGGQRGLGERAGDVRGQGGIETGFLDGDVVLGVGAGDGLDLEIEALLQRERHGLLQREGLVGRDHDRPGVAGGGGLGADEGGSGKEREQEAGGEAGHSGKGGAAGAGHGGRREVTVFRIRPRRCGAGR